MKLVKIILILCVIVATLERKLNKSKKRKSKLEETGNCREYCEAIRNELSYRLDGDNFSFEGKEGEELVCFGKKEGKKHIFYPMSDKKATITITETGLVGYWKCKLGKK
jgi:hypothetical protein